MEQEINGGWSVMAAQRPCRAAILIDAENLRLSDKNFRAYGEDVPKFMESFLNPIIEYLRQAYGVFEIDFSVEFFDTLHVDPLLNTPIQNFQNTIQQAGCTVHTFQLQNNKKELKVRQKGCDAYMTFRICMNANNPEVTHMVIVSGDGDFAPSVCGINEECDAQKEVLVIAPTEVCLARALLCLDRRNRIKVTTLEEVRKASLAATKLKGYRPLDIAKVRLDNEGCPMVCMFKGGVQYLKNVPEPAVSAQGTTVRDLKKKIAELEAEVRRLRAREEAKAAAEAVERVGGSCVIETVNLDVSDEEEEQPVKRRRALSDED